MRHTEQLARELEAIQRGNVDIAKDDYVRKLQGEIEFLESVLRLNLAFKDKKLCKEMAGDIIRKNPTKAAWIFWDGLMRESGISETLVDLLDRALPYINNKNSMCNAECLGTCEPCKIKQEIQEQLCNQ